MTEFVEYLTVEQVLSIHEEMLDAYGGMPGIRDAAVLESAVNAPKFAFPGNTHHSSFTAKAAAYLYHICADHPFVDANKRTAVTAMLVFLRLNGQQLVAPEGELERLVNCVAEGRLSEDELAECITRVLSP